MAGLPLVLTSGCGPGKYQPMPVYIGSSPNALKRSPAADMKFDTPRQHQHDRTKDEPNE